MTEAYICNGVALPPWLEEMVADDYLTITYAPYRLHTSKNRPTLSRNPDGELVLTDGGTYGYYYQLGTPGGKTPWGSYWSGSPMEEVIGAGGHKLVWTNYDLYLDGELYMKATEPIETELNPNGLSDSMRRYIIQSIYDRIGEHDAGVLISQYKQLLEMGVFYLYGTPAPDVMVYGSTTLPELPEWDRTTYPYAYIFRNSSGVVRFQCHPTQLKYGTFTYSGSQYTVVHYFVEAGKSRTYLQRTLTDGVWGEATPVTNDRTNYSSGYYGGYQVTFLWSNTVIPNIDNSNATYFAPSIPAYINSSAAALTPGDGYAVYNGLPLPRLPIWDKAAYPYAYITGTGKLTCTPTKLEYGQFTLDEGTFTLVHFVVEPGSTMKFIQISAENGFWGEPNEIVIDRSSADINYYGWFDKILWCNTDLINKDDGTTYLEASDPIELVSSEPVASVYNGVKLPELPEWDKTTRPYGCLIKNSSGVISLMCTPVPFQYGTYTTSGWKYTRLHIPVAPGEANYSLKYPLENGAWGASVPQTMDNTNGTAINYIYLNAEVFWSNYNISSIDTGGIYLRASTPVLAYEARPVACLYNGVELPELPEWDKENYPYAYINIAPNTELTVLAVFHRAAIYGTHTTNGVEYTRTRVVFYAGEKASYAYYVLDGNAWGAVKVIEVDRSQQSTNGNFSLSNPVWSNTNIPNEDTGGTYLAASVPIPVYE